MDRDQPSEYGIPNHDDGWWASVMAEDENRTTDLSNRQQKIEALAVPAIDWQMAKTIFDQDEIVELQVAGYNRGGLLVEGKGLCGFVPCSHLVDLPLQFNEARREDCFTSFVGKTLRLKVIECVPDEIRLVFSERAALAAAGKRPALFNTILAGQRISGEVTNVTEFGVFVDLGGVEGLIHISELSWGRVSHPGQICRVGQDIEVLIMDVAPERCRIALSLKRLTPNPWGTAPERYPINSIISVEVTALAPFGAFARLEEGLEGLIHASEIPLPVGKTVKECLAPGQILEVRILQVDASRQRIGLSMKLD